MPSPLAMQVRSRCASATDGTIGSVDPASRPRFVVVYQERRLPLPDGELVVGRALGCHIRFNASEVSRQHLRLTVTGGRLVAENLSTTTGTLLNGRRIHGSISLSHGDELTLGPRQIRIEVEDVSDDGPIELGDDDSGDDDVTRPGSLAHGLAVEAIPATIDYHTCPKCRTRVAFGDSTCASCGYTWSDQHPSAVTQRVTLRDIQAPAQVVSGEVPVVYGSDELSLDAIVTDLTTHRAFVPSSLLDPSGTSCELTLLPDGTHAMTVTGVVTSVRAVPDVRGVAGMEVRFTDVPPSVRAWIERWTMSRRPI
jgi:hypothetical protein